MAKHKKRTKNKIKKILITILLVGLLSVGGYYAYINGITLEQVSHDVIGKVQIKNIKIVDQYSKTRPVAVMINNNHQAWPHAGLEDAYLTYEIIAEGGITRMMAVFKDKETAKIGSVRSSRPYYLDYALENDAIYVHYGWSEDAKNDISKLGIDNINGLTNENVFWRDKTLKKALEHTAFTSMENINKFAEEKGYNRDTNKKLLLKYSADDIDLSDREDAIKADTVYMRYSKYTNTSYEYDSENKNYKRFMSSTAHKDAVTGKQYTYKNIIITPIKNSSYDSYGRQKLDNIGEGEGYFITNGYAIPITWTKESRASQTVYKDKNGKEIIVNDGRTFIQITPIGEEIKIEGNTEEN